MKCQKTAFSLNNNVVYLNGAYMSPLLKVVEQAGMEGILRKQNPHLVSPENFFGETETLRAEFARLIKVSDPQRIVVIPSVSYGLANVANNLHLKNTDNIIVAGEQFPSNVYPWREIASIAQAEIKTISAPQHDQNRGRKWNEAILQAIDKHTKMVALGHIHWADGTLFDLVAIRKRTREVGALLVIDGTQSVGALPFDVSLIDPDALICAGYKSMMGPYSIGLAYYGSAFDDGQPIEENWINRFESENFANLVQYNDRYQPGALRYEVGEHSNFILIPMMLAAVKQLNIWTPEAVQAYCRDLVEEALKELADRGYRIEDPNYRASHLFGIRLGPHHNMDAIKAKFEKHKIFVSFRGDAIRISPNVYNTAEDMAQLVAALS